MDNTTTTLRPSMGFSSLQPQQLPQFGNAWDQYQEKKTREEQTSWTDYAGAMWRQDGITDGLIAYTVGQQMVPDPTYSPYAKDEWEGLTKDVWPEFAAHLGQATSAAHGQYLRSLILQKQDDLTKLGDLGMAGTAARFAFGAVSPENLLLGMGGGLVSKGMKLTQIARATKGATTAVGVAEAKAGALAAQAVSKTGVAPVVTGMGTSALGNAAFEGLRQSVNFEDDQTQVLEALLIGAAFPLPFELAGARQANRVAAAALKEHSVLKTLKKLDDGEQLTLAEMKVVDDVIKSHEIVKAVDAGKLTPQQALEQLHGFMGPEMPDNIWQQRRADDLAEQGRAMLDEIFPNRVTERVKGQLGVNEMLKLGYDPQSVQGTPIAVSKTGVAMLDGQSPSDPLAKPKGLSKLELEAAIRAEAKKRFPDNQLEREAWAAQQRQELLGHALEVATPIAKAKAGKKLIAALQKARKEKEAAAKAKRAVSPEEMLLGKQDAPKEAPTSPVEPTSQAAPTDPTIPPVQSSLEAPIATVPTGPKVGETVAWDHPKSGERMWGVLESTREDGFHMIRNEDGKLVPVHPSRLADLDPPEGFVEGGSVGAAQAAPITDVAQQTTKFSKARLDIFAVLNRSESEAVRSLVFQLVKDPIQVDSKSAQGWTASEIKSHIKRTIGGAFHREVRAAAREAAEAMGIKVWQKPQFYHEFHSLTTQLTRGDFTVTQLNPTITPMLQRASAAQRELYAQLLKQMQAVGVKGADELQPNEFYVNRVWNQQNIRAMIDKHGAANVIQLLANSINVPGFNGDVVKAAAFLKAVQKLEYSQTMQTMHLGAKDMGTLRNELSRYLQPDEIDLVVNTMFEAKEVAGSDAGRAPQLKYRFDIGENNSVDLPTGTLKISDLFENDSRVLADSYLNGIGGRIGLAKLGIYEDADFQRMIKEVTDEAVQKNLKGVDEDVALLQDVYANIVGRPMSTQDFSKTARFASAMRGYTRSVSLGQLGITAAFEMKQAIGLMGWNAFWQQMPSLRKIVTAMRNGYIPDDILARDIEHITGFGSEMSMSYARAQEIDDGFLGQQLSRFESVANKASHAVDIMSGNASFTSLTRQLSSKMAAQRLSDFAQGKLQMSPKMRERMVGWGLDDDYIDTVLGQLKQYSTVDSRGKLIEIDWEKWAEESPGSYENFQLVNERMVRDAIQDQDLGETMPFMHSTLGKVFAELKTFFLVAHAKNMLKNVSYMDQTALHVWAVSFIGEAISYSMQASINNIQDQEKLNKMLSPENIVGAAFSRSSVTGMLPFFMNTAFQIGTGGESLPGMGQDMTSSGNGRTFVPPSLQVMQRMYAAPSTAFGLILDTGNVTQKEGTDLYKLLPGSNMIGMRNLGSWLTNSLPKSEPQTQ